MRILLPDLGYFFLSKLDILEFKFQYKNVNNSNKQLHLYKLKTVVTFKKFLQIIGQFKPHEIQLHNLKIHSSSSELCY